MSLADHSPADWAINRTIQILDYDGILTVRDVRFCANSHMRSILTFAQYIEDHEQPPAALGVGKVT